MSRMMSDNPEDPRIQKIREALERNPNLTAYHFCVAYSMAANTLKVWMEKGWIPTIKTQSKRNGTKKWKKTNYLLYNKPVPRKKNEARVNFD